MTYRVIQSEGEYRAVLTEVAALMEEDPEPGTPEGDRLDALVTMVQSYETAHMPTEVHGFVNNFKPGE